MVDFATQPEIKEKILKNLQKVRVPDNSRHYICLSRAGRMGNHMFQYASAYGIARKNNLTVLVEENKNIAEYFKVPSAMIVNSRAICKTFEKKLENKCCVYDPSLTNLSKNRSYFIGPYLQSWKYFKDYFGEVRNELAFKAQIRDSAKVIVDNLKGSVVGNNYDPSFNTTTVGVHVRLGDMFRFSRMEGGFDVAPEGYIQRAVDYFLKRFKNVLFIVCSDGMDYVKRVFLYKNVTVEFIQLDAAHDMAVLSACDHVIMTVGTFGWWAGFLSGGIVMFYKYPMRENSPSRKNYDYDDFFLPSWIGLS